MKALVFHEHGGLDKLTYQDVPDPKIGPGELLVRVRACALNHLDLFVREGIPGLKLPLPFWSGCEFDTALSRLPIHDQAHRLVVFELLYDSV